MKNKTTSPYGTYNLEKIDAPKKQSDKSTKSAKISGKGDLRGGKK